MTALTNIQRFKPFANRLLRGQHHIIRVTTRTNSTTTSRTDRTKTHPASTIRCFSSDGDRIHSTDIAFKPAEAGWGGGSKYSNNFDQIFDNSQSKAQDATAHESQSKVTEQDQDKQHKDATI
eukprot:scaffold224_cov276-Chaetoceros_neogracile.AAC.14